MKPLRKLREDGSPAAAVSATPAAPTNRTGDTASMSMPTTAHPGQVFRRYKQFDLEPETFRKFEKGRMKFERWSKFLNMENENHKAIYDYANQNRKNDHLIVIRDINTGALRAIRRRHPVE